MKYHVLLALMGSSQAIRFLPEYAESHPVVEQGYVQEKMEAYNPKYIGIDDDAFVPSKDFLQTGAERFGLYHDAEDHTAGSVKSGSNTEDQNSQWLLQTDPYRTVGTV